MGGHGFLVDAFIFLTAAVVVVPLAKRGGLGAVLGYLLAGIAVGPYGMGLINQAEDVLHFAEVGVVLMLFLIGLELQPSKLWRLRRPIVGLGGAQVLITGLVIFALSAAAGVAWQSAAVAGMALALSSTAIGLQLLAEKRQLRTATGQSAFSVLLFQDIAVLPMLALLPLLGGNAVKTDAGPLSGLPGWLNAAIVVAVIAGIVLAGRFMLRGALHFIAATGLREISTAFSLFLVIGIALVMQAIGLSPALGAFLAGVVLADSEYRHALETDIEPFKGLLLGLFFISVGMSIDFTLLAADPGLILGLVATLVVVKLALLLALGRAFGLSTAESVLFAVLLGQGGEFAFVLFQFAVGQGAIDAELAARLTAVVALSMVATPLLVILNDRYVQPKLAAPPVARAADVVDDESPVLIVGFGRFGQIIGRLLDACGIHATILDNDPDHLEALRRFGHKAFYGDGSRLDVLHAAGAAQARLIVLTMNDADANVEVARTVRREFPQAKILARARDRNNAFELMAAGVDVIRRETFEAALSLGREGLTLLGMHPYAARRQADTFARHDRQMLREGFQIYEDEASMIALVRHSREQLEELFRADHDDSGRRRDAGWGE
jgi:glutathione-regulated potassium-efflux system ancillary protein KefC